MERLYPDRLTRQVLTLVAQRFAEHPGSLDAFALPVTRVRGKALLDDFIEHCLADFGRYQDAIWRNRVFLYHSRLLAILNLKLLNPRACVETAIEAYDSGRVPLNSVEGFARQILGLARVRARHLLAIHAELYRAQRA